MSRMTNSYFAIFCTYFLVMLLLMDISSSTNNNVVAESTTGSTPEKIESSTFLEDDEANNCITPTTDDDGDDDDEDESCDVDTVPIEKKSSSTKESSVTKTIQMDSIDQDTTSGDDDDDNGKYYHDTTTTAAAEKNTRDDTSYDPVYDYGDIDKDDGITNDDDNDDSYGYDYDDDDDDADDDYDYQPMLCNDDDDECFEWAEVGECDENPDYMLVNCKRSCGMCQIEDINMGAKQKVTEGDNKDDILEIIRLSEDYIINDVLKNLTLSAILDSCNNVDDDCAIRAANGDCESDPDMKDECALACCSCDYYLYSNRCARDPNEKPAWSQPGDLNKMFERLTSKDNSEYEKYTPVVHSRPYRHPDDDDDNKDDDELSYKIGPWVVTFETFLTDEECHKLIEMGRKEGFERSMNVGKLHPDGSFGSDIDDTRTSENSWCNGDCDADPIISGISDRMANLTGIPRKHQEYLQILRYKVGQYYKRHHDFIGHDVDRKQGPRILTFFMYLNDVKKGGGTKFNDLDITITPRKGKAVLWPSVVDDDDDDDYGLYVEDDDETHHEALPVEEGIKFGANAWIHLYDFQGPYRDGCV